MSITTYSRAGVALDEHGDPYYTGLPADLVTMLEMRRSEHGERVAARVPDGGALSYDGLWEAASRVAGGLVAGGLRPGDRVAVRMANGLEWVLAYWGVQLAGAVVVPIGHRLTDSEAAFIVADSGAKACLDDPHGLPVGDPHVVRSRDAERLAAVFYTSGTTGVPKGVMVSHLNAVQNAENQRRMMAAGLGDEPPRSLIAVPLSHITGCHSQMVATLHAGGSSVILPRFSNEGVTRAVGEHEVNMLVAVPTIYWRLLSDPGFSSAHFASVRSLSYGGAPTPPELVRQIKAAFPRAYVQNGFGSTECTGLHTALPDEFAVSHSASVGIAMPTARIRIDEPDRDGVGEILVKGPNVTRGYWNRPDATRESFTEDGWFRMGDLGRLDDDGFLYVVDRLKDMISRGGEKVFSGEVENVLAAVPGVLECAVVSVPDVELGERVGVVVVPADHSQVTVRAAVEHLQEHLAGYKIPEYWHLSPAPLPRNAGGKILKARLKAEVDWASIPVYRR